MQVLGALNASVSDSVLAFSLGDTITNNSVKITVTLPATQLRNLTLSSGDTGLVVANFTVPQLNVTSTGSTDLILQVGERIQKEQICELAGWSAGLHTAQQAHLAAACMHTFLWSSCLAGLTHIYQPPDESGTPFCSLSWTLHAAAHSSCPLKCLAIPLPPSQLHVPRCHLS